MGSSGPTHRGVQTDLHPPDRLPHCSTPEGAGLEQEACDKLVIPASGMKASADNSTPDWRAC